MSGSLQSGVSGLRAHQKMLEVVGNNLANLNTVAFKGARIEFADQLSQVVNAGTRPGSTDQGQQGGINPSQLGLGVSVSNVAIDSNQGSLQATGRVLDMAIQGDGFFEVHDGSQKNFTRAGTMDIDSAGYLVHTTSGMRVANVNNEDIQISNRDIPASVTSAMTLSGNLSADSRPPLAEIQTSLLPYETRGSAAGTNAQPFNLGAAAYNFTLQVGTGSPQTLNLTPGNPITAAAIAAEINSQANGIRALDVGGNVTLQSTTGGPASNFTLTEGAGGPLALLGIAAGTTTGAVSSTATELNDLESNAVPYQAGDVIIINGRDAGATIAPPISFVYGTGAGQHGTTLGDLVTRINTGFASGTVTVDGGGNMLLTANAVGDVDFSLSVGDQTGNVGSTNLAQHTLAVTTDGFDGDTVQTSVEVFDSLGDSHIVDLSFAYQGGNLWDLTVSSNEAGVNVTSGTIQGITFSKAGEFANVQSTPNISMTFDPALGNLVEDMSIALNFGTPGQSDGLTMFAGASEAAVTSQDGNAPGKLTSLSVDLDGTILGLYDNGLSQGLDKIKVVSFSNPSGLLRAGANLWQVSPNSGNETTVGVGTVVSGVLENSNVDTALEFTRLIIAQRGFQVNARTITTTDQMLQELSNLVR
jgi:flagellar hook protein FlgE